MKKPRISLRLVAFLAFVAIVIAAPPVIKATSPAPPGVRIVLWHSQRGREKDVLEALLREFNEAHKGRVVVEPLGVPDGTFKDKLLRTVPRGAGPDVFIRPHNELGELVRDGVARPLEPASVESSSAFLSGLDQAVELGGKRYGVPLTFKGLMLFYNKKLMPRGPPATAEELFAAKSTLPAGVFPLAYDATSFFFQSPFFLAGGGVVFENVDGPFAVFSGKGGETFRLPGELRKQGVMPPEPSYNEAVRLFEAGEAATIIIGPWYTPEGPIAQAKDWDIAPLPSYQGRPMGSYVTVDAAFVASSSLHLTEAEELAAFLGSDRAADQRFAALALPPVRASAYEPAGLVGAAAADSFPAKLARIQRLAIERGAVTPSSTRMAAVWRPAEDVLRASIAGRDVDEALSSARTTLERVDTKTPRTHSPAPAGILLAVVLTLATLMLVRQARVEARSPEATRAKLIGSWGRVALGYLAPGVTATLVLVLVPMLVAMGMSLFEYDGGSFVFVGLDNFRDILLPSLQRAFEARSFYFALGVTILWTLVNVVLHVTLGVALALMLRPAWVRLRALQRIVLVLPWAIPNYITALVWKGMFNAQVGAINALLEPFGFKNFAWFDRFYTAFFANVVTNTWLGFPFMMVVTLGAMTAIPKELEEAATLDGASRLDRLRHIVLPHVKPALVPSIILGSVWTFNMFNVVYLVSGGEPGSQTDILVSEAYRWAFERGQRFGYAAAYSVLIFAFLLIYGRVTRRVTGDEDP
ncbi:MAG: extracellular solute-binding protein [Polyangiaceae bacterium]